MRDAVLLNAAAGDRGLRRPGDRSLVDASAAMARAAEAIDSGAARAKLDTWLTATPLSRRS